MDLLNILDTANFPCENVIKILILNRLFLNTLNDKELKMSNHHLSIRNQIRDRLKFANFIAH